MNRHIKPPHASAPLAVVGAACTADPASSQGPSPPPRRSAPRPLLWARATTGLASDAAAPRLKSLASATTAAKGPAVNASTAGHTPESLLRAVGDLARPTPMGEVADVQAYLYEIKYDGYRLRAVKAGSDVRLVTRGGHDWTARFASVHDAVRALAAREAVLDGEVCVVNGAGRSSLGALQAWLAGRRHPEARALAYVAFDLMWLDGRDLRHEKLEERRGLLETVLKGSCERIIFSQASAPTTREELAALLAAARCAGLEGLVAKRRGSKYLPGTSGTWRKLKFFRRQDCVVIGWMPTAGTSDQLGSLVLAVTDAGELRFAGRVGAGIDDRTRARLRAEFAPLEVDDAPVTAPRTPGARWVRPDRVCEVEYVSWSPDRILRTPVFIRLREDKAPEDCTVDEEEG